MHSAVRAADAFERATYRVAAAQVALDIDGTALPKTYLAACRAVERKALAVFAMLPGLIDDVSSSLTPAEIAGAKSAAAASTAAGDITDCVAMVRILAPYLGAAA